MGATWTAKSNPGSKPCAAEKGGEEEGGWERRKEKGGGGEEEGERRRGRTKEEGKYVGTHRGRVCGCSSTCHFSGQDVECLFENLPGFLQRRRRERDERGRKGRRGREQKRREREGRKEEGKRGGTHRGKGPLLQKVLCLFAPTQIKMRTSSSQHPLFLGCGSLTV